MKGQGHFKGKIVHSSEMDNLELEGKRVVVVGSGACVLEAVALAREQNGRGSTVMLARQAVLLSSFVRCADSETGTTSGSYPSRSSSNFGISSV